MNGFHEEEELGKAYDLKLLRRFLGYLHPHWPVVAATMAILVAGIAVDLAAPFVLRAALDGPVASGDAAGLSRFALIFFVLVVLSGAFEAVQHYVSNLAGQRIIYDLRAETYGHLQAMHVGFFDKNPVGRLLTRVTGDIENLSELFTSGLVGMLSNVLFLIAAVAAMFVIDARLAGLTMLTLPLAVLSSAVFRRHARRTYRDTRKAIAAVTSYLNEVIGGIKTVQAFNRQDACAERFNSSSRLYRDKATEAGYVYSFFWPGIELITTIATAMLLWYGGGEILRGTMSFGSFVAFWYLVRKFFEPIQELAEKYNILQAAMASSERIFRLLDTPPAVAVSKSPASPERKGEVEFKNVVFSYDGKTPVLDDVSFTVKPGETVALVGYTGAGKTSILSLLLRLYDVRGGAVLVDGVDVREHDPRALRRRFGTVFQDVFLFSGTVEENVRMGGAEVPRERLEEALRLVHADRVVRRLPQGLQSELHERGSSVSAGERQLLSFARALASDPPILVLDEATSNIDAETEGLIQDALGKALAGRTAIVVAHRLSTIQKADRILVLHHGRLREEGTHAELLAKGGLYEKLYRLQWQPKASYPGLPSKNPAA